MNYIDIHTHHKQSRSSILSVKNVIIGIDKLPNTGWFSAGIHPWYLNADFFSELKKLIIQPQCLAIGECGMDLMPAITRKYSLQTQERTFLKQAALAEQYKKPLIIHCVKCMDRLLYIKKSFKPEMPWIIHGFTKNAPLARQLTGAGFYLSFGAHLFRSKNNREAFQNTPVNRLFLETDEQTTYDIKRIYQKAATLKNMNLYDLQKQINSNFTQVFKTD